MLLDVGKPTNLSLSILSDQFRYFIVFFAPLMKICLHVVAGILKWSESKYDLSGQFFKAAKKQLQEKILIETGERWNFVDSTGNNGTPTNGNYERSLLHSNEASLENTALKQIFSFLSICLGLK